MTCLLLLFGGCRKDAPQAAAEDAAERASKAERLHDQARAALIPQKYDLLRRLIAMYGEDTAAGKEAFLELVVTLTHDGPARLPEALEVAKKFAARHPEMPDVNEAFGQVAEFAWLAKDTALRKSALDAWSDYLQEHDVAGDVPKAQIYVAMVDVRIMQERWADALVAADTALNEPAISNVERVKILVRKGNLLGDKLGRKPEARVAFQTALELARRNHAAGHGILGYSPEQVESEIKKLD